MRDRERKKALIGPNKSATFPEIEADQFYHVCVEEEINTVPGAEPWVYFTSPSTSRVT